MLNFSFWNGRTLLYHASLPTFFNVKVLKIYLIVKPRHTHFHVCLIITSCILLICRLHLSTGRTYLHTTSFSLRAQRKQVATTVALHNGRTCEIRILITLPYYTTISQRVKNENISHWWTHQRKFAFQ